MANSKRRTSPSPKESTGRKPTPLADLRAGVQPPSAPGQPDGIRVFLSYSRRDDQAFDMIVPFKELLELLVHAKTGRRIASFVDQRDIRWGEIWRNRLSEEILAASVFIPLLSANYLESENCRMEFNKFHSAARGLGVSELLLPIVVIDAPDIFNEGSTDDIVLTAIERQYERIEEAVLTSRGSSEWKRTMARIADRFASAYRAAEATLASLSPDALGSRESEENADEDLDAPGITESMESFTVDLATMTDAVDSLNPAMTEFSEAAQSVHAPKDGATPKDFQLWSFRLATAIRDPAERINREGERLFEATKLLDESIRNLYRLSNDVPGMRSSIDETMGNFGDLSAVRDQLNSLLDSMKPAEALSVPLRKAIRPVRTGVTKVNDSIALIASWMPGQTQ